MSCSVSRAGGAASAGGIRSFIGLNEAIAEATQASIDAEVHLLGGCSFVGSGFPRAQPNSACSLAGWIDLARNPPSSQMSITLFAHELFPVRGDRERRNQLVREHHTAFTAPDVQRHIHRVRSNYAANGPFGNILLPRTTHFRPIPPAQIVTDISQQYLPAVEKILNCPADRGRVVDIEFDYADFSLPDSEELLDRLESIDDDEAKLHCLDSLMPELSARSWVRLSDDSRLSLFEVGELLAEPINSPITAIQRLGLTRAILERLDAELEALCDDEEQISRVADEDATSVVRSVRRLRGEGVLGFRSEAALERQSLGRIERFYESVAVREQTAFEISVLEEAQRNLEFLIESQLDRFTALANALIRCQQFMDSMTTEPQVFARPLDETLSVLIRGVDPQAGDPSFGELLLECADEVTLLGLSRSVGASDTSIESIVSAVTSRSSALESPHWGGTIRQDSPKRFVVYPPVAAQVQTLLTSQHRIQNDTSQVCFADRAAPARTVTCIELRTCNDLRDLFTDYYEIGLRRALESELAPLYLENTDVLKRIGINFQSSQ